MRGRTEVITLLNAQVDPDTGYDVYTPTKITGVSWYSTAAATVTTSGLLAADQYTVRIPVDADFSGKGYVNPIAYKTADPAKSFTIQRGDVIVRGTIDTPSRITAADLSRLIGSDGSYIAFTPPDPTATTVDAITPASVQQTCPDVFTVLSITDNRKAPHAQHWKVIGK